MEFIKRDTGTDRDEWTLTQTDIQTGNKNETESEIDNYYTWTERVYTSFCLEYGQRIN